MVPVPPRVAQHGGKKSVPAAAASSLGSASRDLVI